MWQDFLSYRESLLRDIPMWVYKVGILVLLAGLVICSLTCGIRKGLRYGLGILLIEYILLIYCSTVFFRNTGKLQYDITPFWSYQAYFEGREPNALVENFANVVVFVPVGLLLRFMVRGLRITVRKGWLIALSVGLGLSIGIEVLQFVFKKGFSEIDDVMHNTLGCAIGYGIYCWIGKLFGNYDNKVSI